MDEDFDNEHDANDDDCENDDDFDDCQNSSDDDDDGDDASSGSWGSFSDIFDRFMALLEKHRSGGRKLVTEVVNFLAKEWPHEAGKTGKGITSAQILKSFDSVEDEYDKDKQDIPEAWRAALSLVTAAHSKAPLDFKTADNTKLIDDACRLTRGISSSKFQPARGSRGCESILWSAGINQPRSYCLGGVQGVIEGVSL